MNPILAKQRYKYHTEEQPTTCVFCDVKEEKIIYETKYSLIIPNMYPYLYGHLLIIPKRHVINLEELTKEENFDLLDCILFAKKILTAELNPVGFNIGINLGEAGGSKDHLHWHLVPRYKGDIGFTTTIANIQIFSKEPLEMVKDLKKRAQKQSNK